ncbi:hypothetical protein J2T02_002381 [Chitinophaga terrae (ex Kim and Jung 2007)]|nr:hypothetical protein [Chitinophaga terrae (ex Kim and Jung 2007)]
MSFLFWCPVIYWIEVISDNEIKEILDTAETFKITNRRHVPALADLFLISSINLGNVYPSWLLLG